jgi:NCAIR mutase (PurE)-related protein
MTSDRTKAHPTTIADVGVAQVDLDRQRRCGFPEVVFGQGKPPEAVEKIFAALLAGGAEAFATRIDLVQADYLRAKFPEGRYNELARTFRVPSRVGFAHQMRANERDNAAHPRRADQRANQADLVGTAHPTGGRVAIVTAGTSDLPVAEEARETALWMGVDVTLICDVGVAGPQRLQANLEEIQTADAVVVVAGMEGALPSVVGGHVACPVIAVPTSVGYGANLGGIAALLAMLNSCAANVTVVNIDAGFKGGYLAGMIARRLAEARRGTASNQ